MSNFHIISNFINDFNLKKKRSSLKVGLKSSKLQLDQIIFEYYFTLNLSGLQIYLMFVCLFVSRVVWVLGLAPVPQFAWRTCPYWIYLLQLLALFTRKNYSYCWKWAWPPNSGEGAFSLSGQTDLRSGQYRSIPVQGQSWSGPEIRPLLFGSTRKLAWQSDP